MYNLLKCTIKILLYVIFIPTLLCSVFYWSITPVTKTELLPFADKSIVDFHVHVAGLGYADSGAFINEEMRQNLRFNFYLMAMGVTLGELEEQGDRVLFKKLSTSIRESSVVSSAVILAMDGVIDDGGQLDKALTQVYIPNDYVFKETSQYDNLLFGASINPYRPDAIERLEEVHRQGAVLIKWIPSIMYIDPSDPRIRDFYQKMLELDMPLLSHTGMEKSFSGAKDELADPYKLRLPLDMGVKVIAAHLATTGQSEGQDNFERILPMFKEYPNLYADISSLTQLNKLGFLKKALQAKDIEPRFIYGTDWPLQFFPLVSAWYHLDQITLAEAKAIQQIDNQWDRDVALKVAMGLSKESFYRGRDLFLKPLTQVMQ